MTKRMPILRKCSEHHLLIVLEVIRGPLQGRTVQRHGSEDKFPVGLKPFHGMLQMKG